MKTTLLALLFFVCVNIFAQVPDYNFFDYLKEYYNPFDTAEGGTSNELLRMSKLWGPRLASTGKVSAASHNFVNYVNSFNSTAKSLLSYNPNWISLGPTGENGTSGEAGRMNRICFDPNYNGTTNKTVYAASSFGGLWKTTDDGYTWSNLTDTQLPTQAIGDVVVSSQNSNHVFVATGMSDQGISYWTGNKSNINPLFTAGIYRSTNAGVTWEAINNGFLSNFVGGGTCRKLIIKSTDENIVIYVATTQGIFKTTNAMSANPVWNQIFTGSNFIDDEFRGLEFKPGDFNTIFASGKDIYRTTDGGSTWNSITGTSYGLDLNAFPDNFHLYRINIAVTPANPNKIFAYIVGDEEYSDGIIKRRKKAYIYSFYSNNWNLLFSMNNAPYPNGDQDNSEEDAYNIITNTMMAFAVSPYDENDIFFGHTKVKRSTNGGINFSDISPYSGSGFHADVTDLKFPPVNINTIFCANDGGISMKDLSVTGTGGWVFRNGGLQIAKIWTFDDSENSSDRILIGQQDNGTRKRDNINWIKIGGGDGYGANIEAYRNDKMFWNINGSFITGKNYDLSGSVISYNPTTQQPLLPPSFCSTCGTKPTDSYKVINHPFTFLPYYTFVGEIIKQKKVDIVSTDTRQDLWEINSDSYNVTAQAEGTILDDWQRQFTELAISESNPDITYAISYGINNLPATLTTWQLPSHLFKTTTGFNADNFSVQKWSEVIYQGYPTSADDIFSILTGLAVHPSNPDKIWVTYASEITQYRVWSTADGGIHWKNEDPTGELAYLPVNGIVYQKNTNDRLYIATDAGVYVKEAGDPFAIWEKYGEFSNVRVMELKINYCSQKIRVATFGRGVWEADILPATTNTFEKIITENVTWDGNAWSESNIRVQQGKTLTLTGTLNMAPNSKIIVERSATLIVDGGKITNNCGNMWQGIEVWGNSSANQFTASNQGVVELINGATIENAVQAVRTIKTLSGNLVDLAFTGGIVRANGAKFINCKNAIRFERYHNVYNGNTYNNKSYVQNSTFETNDLALSAAQIPGNYIYLQNVEGITFKGNTFKNLNTTITDPDSRGIGIRSINARYTVTNNTTTYPCIFQGLNYGIYAGNTNALIPVTVTSCSFDLNYTGIGLKGINNAWVTSNTFSSTGSVVPVPRGAGLYLDNCNGYKVEDNAFNGSNGGYYGILLYNYGVINNTIYKNYFVDLDVSIQAGNNPLSSAKSLNPPPGPVLSVSGLRIKCNLFTAGGTADIAVTSGHLGNPQGNCGSITSTANNSFSSGSAASIWVNPGLLPVDYFYYPGGNNMPHNYNASLVIPHQCAATNGTYIYTQGCPSTLSGSGTGSGTLVGKIANYNTQLTTLNNKIDGGNTQTLLNKINSNIAPGTLKNVLLAIGPYLSDTVLIATIKKTNPLPSGILKNIIVPNSPVTNRVAAALNTITLPAGIKQEIQAAQTGISARAILEQQITDLQQQKDVAASELLRYYLNDTTGTKTDSVIIFLASQTDIISQKQLALAYLLKGDCSNATTTINTLPQQTTEDATFKQFYSILATLCTENKTLFDLSPAQMQTVTTLSITNTSVNTAAQSVLTLINGTIFPEIIEELIVPDSLTINGYLYNNPTCNLQPVTNDTIVLLDSTLNIVRLPSFVVTSTNGYFKFNFNDLIYLDPVAKYTFGTKFGAVIQDTIFKTIQEWIATSPVTLNLKKLDAAFASDTVKCNGDTSHFTNKSMYGKKPYSYNWYFGGHATSTETNPVYKYTTPGQYAVRLITTDALSCKDTVIHNVVIPEPVIASFTADTAACKDSVINITNNSTGNNILSTWDFGDNQQPVTCNLQQFTHAFADTGTFTIQLTVTDTNGCTATATQNVKINSCFTLAIFGTLYENPDCGGNPVAGDTLVLKNNSGNIVATVTPAITNINGEFSFNPAELILLDTTALYSITTKSSGYELENISAVTLFQLSAESPLNLNLGHVKEEWSTRFNVPDSLYCRGQFIDLKDNVYVLGTISYQSRNNIAILKYSPSGDLIWNRIFSKPGNIRCIGQAIYVDSLFNVYVTGYQENLNNPYYPKYLTLKYDSTGTLIWSSLYGTDFEYSQSFSLITDKYLNVYVIGQATNQTSYFTLTVVKYDINGNFIWSRPVNLISNYGSVGSKILIDNDNTVVVAGSYGWPINKYVIHKFDFSGNLLWSYISPFRYINDSRLTDLKIDNVSNIFITGSNGIVKCNNSGIQQWMYEFSSANSKIAFDNNNNVWTSAFESLMMFDNITGNLLLQKNSNNYIYDLIQDVSNNIYLLQEAKKLNMISKYDKDGNLIWSELLGNGYFYQFSISKNYNLYTTGGISYYGNNNWISDILTKKYSQCPSSASALRYSVDITQIPDLANNTESEESETVTLSVVEGNEYVKMFPNPNDGNFYFNYSLPVNEICKFAVLDQLGKKVYDIDIKSGRNTIFINSNDFSNGVYYYQVTAGKRLVKTEKLVITK